MKETWLVYDESTMKILDWRTDEVLWWMKVGGGIEYADAMKYALAAAKARGYKLVDSEPNLAGNTWRGE